MKLYHITPLENKESIISYGIAPNLTECISALDDSQRCLTSGVFGFTDIDSAKEFAELNNYFEYAIFTFESDDFVKDSEYDGNSFFCESEQPIKAILIEALEY